MTHHFTASHLDMKAAELEGQAKHALALAQVFRTTPNPLSGHVVLLARALQPYGLAVVNIEAVRMAIAALESFSRLEDEDNVYAQERISEAIASFKQSIDPASITGHLT